MDWRIASSGPPGGSEVDHNVRKGSGWSQDLGVDPLHPLGHARPEELLVVRLAPRAMGLQQCVVVQERSNLPGQRLSVARWKEQLGTLTEDVAVARVVGGERRRSSRHRLEQDDAEALAANRGG